MKMKILALLLSVALISAAGAAQARNDSNFRASAEAVAEVQNNQVLPPAAARAEVAAKLTAWRNTFKTMIDPRTVAKTGSATAGNAPLSAAPRAGSGAVNASNAMASPGKPTA